MRTVRNITIAAARATASATPAPPAPREKAKSPCKPVKASKLHFPQLLAIEQPATVQDKYFSIDPLTPIISKALFPFRTESVFLAAC
jgi:hypothetical protein